MNTPLQLLECAPGERIVLADSPRRALSELLCGKVLAFTGTHLPPRLLPDSVVRWTGVEPEPCITTVEKMIQVLRREQPDTVVAAGGGSVLDAAKAALLSWQTGWPLAKHFGVNRWSGEHPGVHLKRIIAVPTTSGTGSEATPYSNIVDPGPGVKKLISETEIVPEYAILSPALTRTMPPALALATGCDALAHLIEGFLNVGADARCRAANDWARAGIRLIADHLKGAVCGGPDSEDDAGAMAVAAALGGMVIRFKSTGLPHLCSFSWFGRIAHGTAVALLLPACWEYYLGNPAVVERTMALSSCFPGATPEEVIGSYRKFLTDLGVPASLAAFPGITPELLKKTAASGAENRMKLENAPRPVALEQSREILEKILWQAYTAQEEKR